jgi:hypothetical protein
MKRLLVARLILTGIGVAVWGYGSTTDQRQLMYVGMAILAVALLMRFLPRRWFDDTAR